MDTGRSRAPIHFDGEVKGLVGLLRIGQRDFDRAARFTSKRIFVQRAQGHAADEKGAILGFDQQVGQISLRVWIFPGPQEKPVRVHLIDFRLPEAGVLPAPGLAWQ